MGLEKTIKLSRNKCFTLPNFTRRIFSSLFFFLAVSPPSRKRFDAKCTTVTSSKKLNSQDRTHSWSCHTGIFFLNSKGPQQEKSAAPSAPALAKGPRSLTGKEKRERERQKDMFVNFPLWASWILNISHWVASKTWKVLERLINLPKGFYLTAEQESNLWKAEADILEKKRHALNPRLCVL